MNTPEAIATASVRPTNLSATKCRSETARRSKSRNSPGNIAKVAFAGDTSCARF